MKRFAQPAKCLCEPKKFAPPSRCLRKPKRFAPPRKCLHKPKRFEPPVNVCANQKGSRLLQNVAQTKKARASSLKLEAVWKIDRGSCECASSQGWSMYQERGERGICPCCSVTCPLGEGGCEGRKWAHMRWLHLHWVLQFPILYSSLFDILLSLPLFFGTVLEDW
jgi:hypothetical protein